VNDCQQPTPALSCRALLLQQRVLVAGA